ncbi:MAG: Na(+)/H(+) antiporter subunit B [Anaerolineae bacterium]
MVELLLVIAAVACAIQAIRADRLLNAALWLAGASAFMAMIFYGMGAREVAIIELSVGAGLVTVLFVFAISVAGDESIEGKPAVPRALAAMLAGLCIIGLIWLLRDIAAPTPTAASAGALTTVLWEDRALDVLAQVALIFTGVIGMLGLLAEPRAAQADVRHANEPRMAPAEAILHHTTVDSDGARTLEKEAARP